MFSSSTLAPTLRAFIKKNENKYAQKNPVGVRLTPKGQKGVRKFFKLFPKDSEKENTFLKRLEAGLGTAKRKALHSQPITDEEKEYNFHIHF